jgi:hypothetical protein
MKCVDSPEECMTSAAFQAPPAMDVSFNPFVNNTIVYAYHDEKVVARLHLPSNSIGVTLDTSAKLERDIY